MGCVREREGRQLRWQPTRAGRGGQSLPGVSRVAAAFIAVGTSTVEPRLWTHHTWFSDNVVVFSTYNRQVSFFVKRTK